MKRLSMLAAIVGLFNVSLALAQTTATATAPVPTPATAPAATPAATPTNPALKFRCVAPDRASIKEITIEDIAVQGRSLSYYELRHIQGNGTTSEIDTGFAPRQTLLRGGQIDSMNFTLEFAYGHRYVLSYSPSPGTGSPRATLAIVQYGPEMTCALVP